MIFRKGTIVQWIGDKRYFKLFEDSKEHGCPFVIEINKEGKEIGKRKAMTLYLYTDSMRVVPNN